MFWNVYCFCFIDSKEAMSNPPPYQEIYPPISQPNISSIGWQQQQNQHGIPNQLPTQQQQPHAQPGNY